MLGIMGAFLGFLISFLISLVLIQPGGIQDISLLIAQPIYILFIVISTMGGGAIGYLCKAVNVSAIHKREERDGGNPEKLSAWAADVIVVVFAILFALVVYVESRSKCILYFFISPLILGWFVYRTFGAILKFFKADKVEGNPTTSK